MKHFEYKYRTPDNLELFAQSWEPQDSPKAVICLVHGVGEHSSRYVHLAEYITDKGFALTAFDLRGHGKSEGKRGHTPSYVALLDDIKLFLDKTADRFPSLPQFLYGHSFGGNLIINFAIRVCRVETPNTTTPPINGIIASSPWLHLSFEPPKIKVTLAKMMNNILPSFSQSSELNTKALSRDPEVVNAYENDPLVHDLVSARLFISAYQAGLWALEHANELEIPLLLMHGSDDELTSPAASSDFAKRCAVTPQHDVTFKMWEGFYHEIHNEPEKLQVFAFLTEWMEKVNTDYTD